jgi:hypothetical protein
MQSHPPAFTLRQVLWLDAVTCALMGAALIAASGWLSAYTAIPQPLLFWAGVVLVPIAIFMALVGWRPSAFGAWIIIAGNVVWVAASIALLAVLIAPNFWGVAFIVVQAVAVAALAWLEFATLARRRSNIG